VEPENERGPEKVVACTPPVPLVERRVELTPRLRLVVDAPPENVWRAEYVFASVVRGMVVEELRRYSADEVENAAPVFCARKNTADDVEKAAPWFCERKYAADVVAQRDCVVSQYATDEVENAAP
jgi:hypothetical protein